MYTQTLQKSIFTRPQRSQTNSKRRISVINSTNERRERSNLFNNFSLFLMRHDFALKSFTKLIVSFKSKNHLAIISAHVNRREAAFNSNVYRKLKIYHVKTDCVLKIDRMTHVRNVQRLTQHWINWTIFTRVKLFSGSNSRRKLVRCCTFKHMYMRLVAVRFGFSLSRILCSSVRFVYAWLKSVVSHKHTCTYRRLVEDSRRVAYKINKKKRKKEENKTQICCGMCTKAKENIHSRKRRRYEQFIFCVISAL